MTRGGPDSAVTGVKGSLWDEWPQALEGRGWGLLRLSVPSVGGGGLPALWAQPTPPGGQGVRGQGPLLLSLPRDSACFLLWVPHAPYPHTRFGHTPTIPHSPCTASCTHAHTHTEGCATVAGGQVTSRCRHSWPRPGFPSHSALRTRGWAAPLKPPREKGLTRMGLLHALARPGGRSHPRLHLTKPPAPFSLHLLQKQGMTPRPPTPGRPLQETLPDCFLPSITCWTSSNLVHS